MYYCVTYKCGKRTFSIEVNFGNDAAYLSDDYIISCFQHHIEKYKTDEGLNGKKHTITNLEISIDRENWFKSESNIDNMDWLLNS